MAMIQPSVQTYNDLDHEWVDPAVLDGAGKEGVKKALLELRDLGAEHGFKTLLFGAMNRDIVHICKEIELNYLNIFEAIPKDTYPDEYGLYFMHPRAKGHAVLARHLEYYLRTNKWIR